MSITLITGVPGSGKTLYSIDKLLRALQGATSDKVLPDGSIEKIPRVLYSNINGLLLDHELIEGGGSWSSNAGKNWVYEGNPQALRNWHEWAKPGSIICFDEFQKFWPPRPNGAQIPPDLQTLDTHRHMGVDFILVTQNCMNVDRHIIGLVDRHLHVRRVANMNMAVVYEWDHASKTLQYKNAMTKTPWRYDKGVFKLYKSAEVHTKQKRSMPGLIWFVLAGLAGAAYGAPMVYGRIYDRSHGVKPGVSAAAPDQPKVGEKMQYTKDGIVYTVEKTSVPVPVPVVPGSNGQPLPVVPLLPAGCFKVADKCGCMDSGGLPFKVEPGFCEAHILGNSVPGQKLEQSSAFQNIPDLADIPDTAEKVAMDLSVYAFLGRHR